MAISYMSFVKIVKLYFREKQEKPTVIYRE